VRSAPGAVRRLPVALTIAATLAFAGAAQAATPTLRFRVFAHTGLRLADVVWTGKQFLYVENTTNKVFAAPPAGTPIAPFAAMPRLVEETRCALSPGNHDFPAGEIFCHTPDNKIYELSPDGKHVSVFASLPVPTTPAADGALAFDTVGHFGYRLVAATGRSGNPTPSGGTVFAIGLAGNVQRVGGYAGPGGADAVAIAPAGFGSVGGQALLTVDRGPREGKVVAMDEHGKTRTVARLPHGPNPIAFVAGSTHGAAAPGLYATDTLSRNVFFAPASQLSAYAGDAVVGSELEGLWWVIRPRANGFQLIPLQTNLEAKQYNLEGAKYVG
jgi:hypothetical protein